MGEEFIDSTEAARILQVSAGRVAASIIKKAGVPFRRVGIAYIYSRADIESLAAQRGGRRGPGRPSQKATA